MAWLEISIAANVLLVIALVSYSVIYSRNIRHAKLSTFSYVLGAMSYSVAVNDNAARFERLAFALKPLFGNFPVELTEDLLRQSATLGYLSSKEPSLIDVVPEQDRYALVKFADRHSIDHADLDEMWASIKGMIAGEIEYVEPVQRFGAERLKKAQILAEARLVSFYDQSLKKSD